MAVGDIRLRVTFARHPKRIALKAKLKAEGVLALLDLWLFAAQYRQDGNLVGLSIEQIEDHAGWRGRAGRLVETLLSLGWLDAVPGGFVIHDWADEQPMVVTAKEREAAGRENARKRWSGKGSANANGTGPPNGVPIANGNAPSLSFPGLTDPDRVSRTHARKKEKDPETVMAEALEYARQKGIIEP